MRDLIVVFFVTVLAIECGIRPVSAEQTSDLLRQIQVIPLKGVEGRIDHFGLDATGKRLFVAALGNDTAEVVDLATGKVTERIKALRTPQGISFAQESNRLAIANDGDGSVRLYDGNSLKELGAVDLKEGADNVRYDAKARRFWVGYGDGGLAAIDPATATLVADIKLESHPESFQLEAAGRRIFVNVTKAGHIAVIDREQRTVIAKWPVAGAASNFPMALDESNHRLFIGCRTPAKLLVLDTETGKTVAGIEIVEDTDDVFYDPVNKRLYVSGGGGHITVITQADANTYTVAGQVATAAGARTSFFVPGTGMLYVAVPHRGNQNAELRVFKTEPKK